MGSTTSVRADGTAPVGVVLMAYGTPAGPDDIETYYTHIRRGRPPSSDDLAELTARYDALGGVSGLAARTEAQRVAIQGALDEISPGGYVVVVGQKHAPPFIDDAVAALAATDVERVTGLVLAPHYSRASVGSYLEQATDACTRHDLPFGAVTSWHLLPEYLDFLAEAIRDARASLPGNHKILFTAHSLPERVLRPSGGEPEATRPSGREPDARPSGGERESRERESRERESRERETDDPYPGQLQESAAAVAERLGLSPWADWALAWQSAGRTPEPWRGPDVNLVIAELAATGRAEGVLVCAQGFVSDHLEVRYDLDIESAAVAAEVGLAFARTRALNDHPPTMAALAELLVRCTDAARAVDDGSDASTWLPPIPF